MRQSLLFAAIAFTMVACSASGDAGTAAQARPFTVTTVADFDSPWAMAFLPDARILVTEKDGRMLLVSADGQQRKALSGIPAVSSDGQGALMDVVLHPKFAENHWVYFSYSATGPGGKGVVLARGTFTDGEAPGLTNVQTLFKEVPFVGDDLHFSGRIAFAPDGHLFFTNGERFTFIRAQQTDNTLGKVLRLNDDGTPATGNPLTAQGFRPEIWSYGHRNLLGIAFDQDGNLWEEEMGPMGGDEVNLILPGRNYGWPKASNGSNYDGTDIPDHRAGDGYEAPKVWWNPSISPASMMVYSGKLWPQWKGDLFLGALSGMALVRVHRDGTNASKADQWDMGTRIRSVREGPDGAIWLLEDGSGGAEGAMMKLTPAS